MYSLSFELSVAQLILYDKSLAMITVCEVLTIYIFIV